MEIIDYNKLQNEIVEFISKKSYMALATCSNQHVTARMINVINDGLDIYFLTSNSFTKFKQISRNPYIALCVENMQYEGKAEIMGNPLENQFFKQTYQKKHEKSFDLYAYLKDSIVIKIYPMIITLWKYVPGIEPYREYLNVPEKKALKDFYHMCKSNNQLP